MQPPPAATPVSVSRLKTALRRYGVKRGVWAVALSGGPDSLALAALLAEITPVRAFIVDHGLRKESAAEARAVQRRARALGIKAHILKWQGDKPASGVMAAARQARYRLLVEAAHKYKCTHLFLAHHRDDQLETVAMRRAEGSGWQGLAGMPLLSQLGAVTLVRPLLDVTKAELVATCSARGLVAVDDPSNRNPKYTRARLRLEGRDLAALAYVQKKAAARRNRLIAKAGDTAAPYLQVPARIDAEMLRIVLQSVGQEDKPIKQEALEELLARLKAGRGATLAGCIITPEGLVVREPAAIAPMKLHTGRHTLWWDRRWRLSFSLKSPHVLAPLGKNTPWRQLKGTGWLEDMPGPARMAVPALWRDRQLVAVLKGHWLPYYHPARQVFVEK